LKAIEISSQLMQSILRTLHCTTAGYSSYEG